jgi:response regulator NasT
MRVWLVDDPNDKDAGSLEALLRQLAERPGTGLRLVGACGFQADLPLTLRKLVPDFLDVLVVRDRTCPDTAWTPELLTLGPGILVATEVERLDRYRALAENHPLGLVAAPPTAEGLWLALVSLLAGQRRETQWRTQVARLEQRLNDRIVIERAKGILVQRLRISEEEAYNRLRVLSRRQRRQIRDIAQSLLDAQLLFSEENNGPGSSILGEAEREAKEPPSAAP